ncbi:hypothetical protein DOY81_003361 [Sarcophaga bullata]|nr:hypothetical protein DOY81_003361 [Sarcophaga bullata]
MNTPRKNVNYNSPYTRPVQAYPSQSEDYISLDMGGLKTQQQQQPNKTVPSTKYNETTPGHYNGKYYQQNQRNSHHKNNRHNSFNNNYNNTGQNNNRQQNFKQQHQRFTPRNKQPYSHDSGAGSQQQQRQRPSFKSHNDNNSSIASYVHPSMTEDPWCNLIKRAQALRNSSISFNDKTSLETNSTSTDSDNASDEVADDSLTALTD